MKLLSLVLICLTLSACDTEVKHNDNFERTTSELNSSIQSLNNTITDYIAVDTAKKCDK